jgi:hypothetical protein
VRWQFALSQVHSVLWAQHIPCGLLVPTHVPFDVSMDAAECQLNEHADAQRIAIQWCRAVGLQRTIYNPKLAAGA